MPSANPGQSTESEIRTLWRLRLKHPTGSAEARSYRQAILDKVRRLRALRLAREANNDRLLSPVRKKIIPQGGREYPPSHEPSES